MEQELSRTIATFSFRHPYLSSSIPNLFSRCVTHRDFVSVDDGSGANYYNSRNSLYHLFLFNALSTLKGKKCVSTHAQSRLRGAFVQFVERSPSGYKHDWNKFCLLFKIIEDLFNGG
jgi:hypothetical protein